MGALIELKRFMQDSLTNLVNGLGGPLDPITRYQYQFTAIPRDQIEAAYRGNWLARKIVDAPAEDATREWREWKAEPDQIEQLEEAERKFDMRRMMRKALSKARAYGGSAVVMGVANQGRSEEPLDIEQVGKDDLKFLAVFHQYELTAQQRIKDINSEWFGRPEYYTLSSSRVGTDTSTDFAQGTNIHPSRVIPLIGADLPDDALFTSGLE